MSYDEAGTIPSDSSSEDEAVNPNKRENDFQESTQKVLLWQLFHFVKLLFSNQKLNKMTSKRTKRTKRKKKLKLKLNLKLILTLLLSLLNLTLNKQVI